MSTRSVRRSTLAAAALSLTAILAACGSSDSTDSATSAAASAAESVAASVTATDSATPATESAACKQWDELDEQIRAEGATADVTSQLEQIEQLAKEEGDKEAEAAAKELLATEDSSAGWNEALEQMEAVCGGERDGN